MNSDVIQTIVDYLDENDLKYERVPNQPVITIGFSTGEFHYRTLIVAEEERHTVQLMIQAPIRATSERRVPMAEYLTRANYGLTLGNFELDMADGEIRYKNSICTHTQPFHRDMMIPLIVAALSTMDRYMPGAIKVIHGNTSPNEAIDQIENGGVSAELRRMLDDDAAAA